MESKDLEKDIIVYRRALEAAFRWLLFGVYEEATEELRYRKAIENKNYTEEYRRDLKAIREGYLSLKKSPKKSE